MNKTEDEWRDVTGAEQAGHGEHQRRLATGRGDPQQHLADLVVFGDPGRPLRVQRAAPGSLRRRES
ncbi:hypothetical protein CTI14_42270, partial [Methylobacterium radiotolerans]